MESDNQDKATLILASGATFTGTLFGAKLPIEGEIGTKIELAKD
jgi:cytoskeletal protein CcmA (bactofilin family)